MLRPSFRILGDFSKPTPLLICCDAVRRFSGFCIGPSPGLRQEPLTLRSPLPCFPIQLCLEIVEIITKREVGTNNVMLLPTKMAAYCSPSRLKSQLLELNPK